MKIQWVLLQLLTFVPDLVWCIMKPVMINNICVMKFK